MKKLIYLIVLLFTAGLISCSNEKSTENAALDKNKEAMKGVMNAFEKGSSEGLENFVADNFMDHMPDPNIKTTGLQGLKDAVALYHNAFPDSKMEVISLIAEGDKVTCQFRWTGTNSGPMGAMPATNKPIDVTGVDIVRFENGKGVEHWGYWEENKMMTQLGLMPDQNSMAEKSTAEPAAEGKK